MLKLSTVFIHTSSEGQQFMQCFWFFQQPESTKPCSIKGSCRSANGSSSCAEPQKLFPFFTFSPQKNTQFLTYGYFCKSWVQEKQETSLNLCYLNYSLPYGCVNWWTIHSNKTEQMQNFTPEWNQRCRIKPILFGFLHLLQSGPEWKWQVIPPWECSHSIFREIESRWSHK